MHQNASYSINSHPSHPFPTKPTAGPRLQSTMPTSRSNSSRPLPISIHKINIPNPGSTNSGNGSTSTLSLSGSRQSRSTTSPYCPKAILVSASTSLVPLTFSGIGVSAGVSCAPRPGTALPVLNPFSSPNSLQFISFSQSSSEEE